MSYTQTRDADTVTIEIKDSTHRLIHRMKFNIKDKNSILKLFGVLEKFSGFSAYELVEAKIKGGEWF